MTQLRFIEVMVGNLGSVLVLLSNGLIIVERGFGFVPTYDYSKDGVTACFDADGFSLMEKDGEFEPFSYGTAYEYKQMPAFKAWLIQQQLQLN